MVNTPVDYNDNLDPSEYTLDFRVIAGMEEDNFVSETVQGYSVDNIDPSEPVNLSSAFSSESVAMELNWNANSDEDLSHYLVFRDETQIGTSEVSEYSDIDLGEMTGEEVIYTLKAVDVHGNESDFSTPHSNLMPYLFPYSLESGNSLISLPGNLESTGSQDLLQTIIDDGTDINFLITQGFGLFSTETGWSGNLTDVNPYSGYWINTSNAYTWELLFAGGSVQPCESYSTSTGNNLLSYKWGKGSSPTFDALGGEEFATENFNFIIGQGFGLFNTGTGWSGNLTEMIEGKGYWVNIINDIDFRWGFNDCENAPTGTDLTMQTIENNIPEEYQFTQSTEQAFYLIRELTIDGRYPDKEDIILAFHNDILVGSAQYNSDMITLPVMGRDISEQTIGFIEEGQKPSLKLYKSSTGQMIELDTDLEGFSNLLVSEVESITGSTMVIPTEYALHPAYPNPFNPITNIKYSLPIDSKVTLEVYNINGKLINTLYSGLKSAGNYTIEWNAEGYPSGVYFVKLDAEEFTQTQKLMLVKKI